LKVADDQVRETIHKKNSKRRQCIFCVSGVGGFCLACTASVTTSLLYFFKTCIAFSFAHIPFPVTSVFCKLQPKKSGRSNAQLGVGGFFLEAMSKGLSLTLEEITALNPRVFWVLHPLPVCFYVHRPLGVRRRALMGTGLLPFLKKYTIFRNFDRCSLQNLSLVGIACLPHLSLYRFRFPVPPSWGRIADRSSHVP